LRRGFPAIENPQSASSAVIGLTLNQHVPRCESMRKAKRQHHVIAVHDPMPTRRAPVCCDRPMIDYIRIFRR
jgi:hypothetical protein